MLTRMLVAPLQISPQIYIDLRLNTDDFGIELCYVPLENFRSWEVRICWRHCSNNSGSLPLTPSGLSSLKSVDQNTTHSQNSCPEKDLSSYASSIVLHSCQKRICRHLFLFHGPSKCLFFSEQEVCKEYEWKRLRTGFPVYPSLELFINGEWFRLPELPTFSYYFQSGDDPHYPSPFNFSRVSVCTFSFPSFC